MDTLAIIEGIHKRLGRTFSKEEIEAGILENLIEEEDYNLERVVSLRSNAFITGLRSALRSNVFECDLSFNHSMFFLQRTDLQKEKRKALSDEAKQLYREDPSLFKAAEEDFKSILQPFLIFIPRI